MFWNFGDHEFNKTPFICWRWMVPVVSITRQNWLQFVSCFGPMYSVFCQHFHLNMHAPVWNDKTVYRSVWGSFFSAVLWSPSWRKQGGGPHLPPPDLRNARDLQEKQFEFPRHPLSGSEVPILVTGPICMFSKGRALWPAPTPHLNPFLSKTILLPVSFPPCCKHDTWSSLYTLTSESFPVVFHWTWSGAPEGKPSTHLWNVYLKASLFLVASFCVQISCFSSHLKSRYEFCLKNIISERVTNYVSSFLLPFLVPSSQ